MINKGKMKVKKFGGTSVGSAERIKNVGTLITEKGQDIIVLSAMSGTTNSLLEVSSAIKTGDGEKAKVLTDKLHENYHQVASELYSTEEYKKKAEDFIDNIFKQIKYNTNQKFSESLEKE